MGGFKKDISAKLSNLSYSAVMNHKKMVNLKQSMISFIKSKMMAVMLCERLSMLEQKQAH